MKERRLRWWHIGVTALVTLAVALGGACLAARLFLGDGGLSLVKGYAIAKTRFVGEWDETAAVDGALKGMVDGLGDRWSHYLTAEEYKAQNQRRSNTYVGVGITVTYGDERGLLIKEVRPDGPADRADVRVGELVTAVDGVSVAGEARYQGADAIGGEAGTGVTLTLLAEDGRSRDADLIRESLPAQPVHRELLDGGVGYVRLDNFYTGSAEKLEAAVADLRDQGAEKLVFDMRDNGGGFVDELTDMLDYLLPEGPIFRTHSKDGREEVVVSDADCVDLPMAVLVNENTYSAAEFFAAELREHGAVVVGTETSGKGYSQQALELPNGGALNLSTARYSTGNGVSLIGAGVTLDKTVTDPEEQLAAAIGLLG